MAAATASPAARSTCPSSARNTKKVYKCTLCVDRVSVGLEPACIKACPTSCLQFGTKENLLLKAKKRVDQLKATGFATAGIYDPGGVGGTGVVSILAYADKPEAYGLPANPTVPVYRGTVEAAAEVDRQSGHRRRHHRHLPPLPALRTQARSPEDTKVKRAPATGGQTMSTVAFFPTVVFSATTSRSG